MTDLYVACLLRASSLQLANQQRENNVASAAASALIYQPPPLPLKLFSTRSSNDIDRQRPPLSTAPGKHSRTEHFAILLFSFLHILLYYTLLLFYFALYLLSDEFLEKSATGCLLYFRFDGNHFRLFKTSCFDSIRVWNKIKEIGETELTNEGPGVRINTENVGYNTHVSSLRGNKFVYENREIVPLFPPHRILHTVVCSRKRVGGSFRLSSILLCCLLVDVVYVKQPLFIFYIIQYAYMYQLLYTYLFLPAV